FPFPALSIQEIITRDLRACTKSNIYSSRAHNDGSFLGFPFYERANKIAAFEFLNSWNLASWDFPTPKSGIKAAPLLQNVFFMFFKLEVYPKYKYKSLSCR
ncbi:MAG: hypothetical protein EA412_13650, partial [Chitinophagaceae bacterium]